MKKKNRIANGYIGHFKKILVSKKRLKVVLHCRESRWGQEKAGNLNDQELYLRRRIRKYQDFFGVKIQVLAVFREVASGWKDDRIVLIEAARVAKSVGAVLVAESTCRFVRSRKFHSSRNPNVLPSVSEYEALKEATQGVPLYTIMPPNRKWRKVRAYQTKRGKRCKKRPGGRPKIKYSGYKKEKRDKNLESVLRLHVKGYSVAEIVRETGIARSTVVDWLRKYQK